MIWAIVISGRFNETYLNIHDNWTLDEVLAAVDILDAIEDATAPKATPIPKRDI